MTIALASPSISRAAGDRATGVVLAAGLATGWLAIHFGGIFAFPLTAATWPLAVPLVLAETWLSTGLFIIAHDCMHGSFAPGRAGLNRGVGRVMLMIYAGLDYDRLLPNHFAHHRHTGTARDPDFDADHPTQAGPWLYRFFARYTSVWQIVRIVGVLWLYHLGFGASWLNITVFYALPALLALVQLFWFGTFLPHRHGHGAFADHHNARSSAFGPVLSVLTCFNFGGYHHEHHLHPQVPWWRLPATRRASARAARV